jgi:hypothetical protein
VTTVHDAVAWHPTAPIPPPERRRGKGRQARVAANPSQPPTRRTRPRVVARTGELGAGPASRATNAHSSTTSRSTTVLCAQRSRRAYARTTRHASSRTATRRRSSRDKQRSMPSTCSLRPSTHPGMNSARSHPGPGQGRVAPLGPGRLRQPLPTKQPGEAARVHLVVLRRRLRWQRLRPKRTQRAGTNRPSWRSTVRLRRYVNAYVLGVRSPVTCWTPYAVLPRDGP